MSYILDALKKAERDRRRAHVPSLATMHSVPAERRTRWPWVVGGLVTVNVIGFAALFMLRPGAPPAMPAGAPPAIPAIAAPPAPPSAPPVVVKAPAPEPAVTPPTSAAREPAPVARRTTPPREPAKARAPVALPVAPAGLAAEDLRLEVLVYSEEVAQRAAYINGHRYVEGQRVGGRFLVEQILRDVVVLTANGQRYALRQE